MIFADDFVALIPRYQETDLHRHAMIHLILSREPIRMVNEIIIRAHLVAIASFTPHQVKTTTHETVVLLLDPSSRLGKAFAAQFLNAEYYCAELTESLETCLSFALNGDWEKFFPSLWQNLGIEICQSEDKDPRVAEIISRIKSGELICRTVPELAQTVFLSESRLAHLFKEITGMNLKNYLLLNKMRYAFQMIQAGSTITEAAHASGFYDSAHLAKLVRQTTGITLSDIFR